MQLQEEIITKASPQKVWASWSDTYRWKIAKGEGGFHIGREGYVVDERKKSAAFKIVDIQKGKSFTIMWRSYFVKMLFTHSVVPYLKGARITCQVKFKGIFAPLMRIVLSNKIRKHIRKSLEDFTRQLEFRK